MPSIVARPANLQTRRPLLQELDLEFQKHARFDGLAELRVLDRHEIDELARVREAEGFDREDAGGLRQRLDDQDARHDRTAREVSLEELLVDRHRLDGDDRLIRDDALDPVHQEQWITMGKRRHHPLDVERADRGAFHTFVHRPCGCCCCCCCCCGSGVTLTDGSAWFSAASTSVVTSIDESFASVESFATAMDAPRRGTDLLDDLD